MRAALKLIAALAVIAAAASIAVVAGAFALFSLLISSLGVAGAAALVAVAGVALAVLVGLLLLAKTRPSSDPDESPDLLTRTLSLVNDKPLVAALGAVALGAFAIRNPKLLGALFSAFVAKRAVSPKKR